MDKKVKNILSELDVQLEVLETETEGVLERAEKGIKITTKALEDLRQKVSRSKFKNSIAEINFFKQVKPQVCSKLVYYVKLFNIESKRPRGSSKSQIKYLNRHIDRLQVYFNDNLEFYHYYRRGATSLDKNYFIRGKSNIRLFPDTFHFFTDKYFSTSHDCTVATIMAYDMLIVYLKKEIDNLENKNGMETVINPFQNQSRLFWTANKTDLIELIYAIQSSGAINSGTADIKELASACEHIFNIDLGDFYRTFLEIKSRKINQTKFIDNIKESLLKRIEDSDE